MIIVLVTLSLILTLTLPRGRARTILLIATAAYLTPALIGNAVNISRNITFNRAADRAAAQKIQLERFAQRTTSLQIQRQNLLLSAPVTTGEALCLKNRTRNVTFQNRDKVTPPLNISDYGGRLTGVTSIPDLTDTELSCPNTLKLSLSDEQYATVQRMMRVQEVAEKPASGTGINTTGINQGVFRNQKTDSNPAAESVRREPGPNFKTNRQGEPLHRLELREVDGTTYAVIPITGDEAQCLIQRKTFSSLLYLTDGARVYALDTQEANGRIEWGGIEGRRTAPDLKPCPLPEDAPISIPFLKNELDRIILQFKGYQVFLKVDPAIRDQVLGY